MKITRNKIINKIQETLEDLPYVYALWLEGSDGLGSTDEYSDIDFVADVEDGFEEKVFNIVEESLCGFGTLDLNYNQYVNHPKIFQRIFHITETSEYLLIDFNIQSHSRNKDESKFVNGDLVEAAKILFDKGNIVTIKEEDFNLIDIKEDLLNKILEYESRYQQHSRVIKYIKRNQYLEAYLYYMKYVVDPIVNLIRFKYTPKYNYLHLIHISNHIPNKDLKLIEEFYKISNLEDIREMTYKSVRIFNKLLKETKENLDNI